MDITALAASNPLFDLFDFVKPHLSFACFRLKEVIIPLPIGLLYFIEISKMDLKVDLLINSKCGVFPFITHPKAIKPSNLFIFRFMAIGISNIPGTFKILVLTLFYFKTFFEEFISLSEMIV